MYYIKKRKTDKPKKKRQASIQTLTKKLDVVYSKYIRLRDAMEGGSTRCISCGQIKPFDKMDCGHFHSRTHKSTRWDEDNTHSECSFCLTPDSLILTDEFRWVKLGEIKEGQGVFAFEEFRGNAQARYWKRGVVTHIHNDMQEVYDVELENGDHVKTTAEHMWLCRKRCNSSYSWVATKDLWVNGYNLNGKKKSGPHTGKTCSVVCKPLLVVNQDLSYESGWLAGMIDADGHICQQNIHNADGSIRYGFRIGVAQCEKYIDICNKIKTLIEKFTNNNKTCKQNMERDDPRGIFKHTYKAWQFLVTGTNIEKLHFLMRIRPNKISKVDIDKLGMIRSRYDAKVKSITPLGVQPIVVMETDTHTFIANGYAMHNCNRFRSDHLIGYRENLIRKIGLKRFELLNWKAHQTKKWSCFELEELIKYYTILVDKLSKEKGIKV